MINIKSVQKTLCKCRGNSPVGNSSSRGGLPTPWREGLQSSAVGSCEFLSSQKLVRRGPRSDFKNRFNSFNSRESQRPARSLPYLGRGSWACGTLGVAPVAVRSLLVTSPLVEPPKPPLSPRTAQRKTHPKTGVWVPASPPISSFQGSRKNSVTSTHPAWERAAFPVLPRSSAH